MSGFVPPQSGEHATPAKGALRTGNPGRKRKAASSTFADALFSLVPQKKGPNTGTRKTTAVHETSPAPRPGGPPATADPGFHFTPVGLKSKQDGDHGTSGSAEPREKRSEKEIRRKERNGKTSRDAALPPAGAEIAPATSADRPVSTIRPPETPPSKNPTAVLNGSAASPGLVAAGVPAAGVAGVILSGSNRGPSSGETSANPAPQRASTRSRERSQLSTKGVQEETRRADVPSGPQTKRHDRDAVNRQIVAEPAATLQEKGAVPPPLSRGTDPPAVDARTDAPVRKKHSVETPRENVAAASVLPRSAPPDPARTENRNAGTVPIGVAPGADSPRKPGSGKPGSGREEPPRKESGAASAGTETADPNDRKGGAGASAAPTRNATGVRPDAPERGTARLAESADPAKSGTFSGLLSAASGVEPGPQGAGAPATPAPAAPRHEASLPPPLHEQVAMKMTPLPDGAHDVEIRLTPEHLGKLKIELHIDSGRMDASVHADNIEARTLLLREEPALREALRNAGVTLSSFNVALSGEAWRERKGGAHPNGDADSAPRRRRKEEPLEGVTAVSGEDVERGGMYRTEHWIA